MNAMARSDWRSRFWLKVNKTDTCWLWTGGLTTNGYGRFYKHHDSPMSRAHRLAYQELVGPVPEGLDLDHLCRVRHCVRPDHLEPVTRKENLHRGSQEHWGWQRDKEACVNGHPLSGTNVYVRPDRPNRRECKTCRAEADRRHKDKRHPKTA